MPAIRAVIFDLDDTLLDHQTAAAAGVREWLATLGCEPTPELVARWFELERRYFDAAAAGEISVLEHRRRRIVGMLAAIGERDTGRDAQLDRLFSRYIELYAKHWQPFEDVADGLAAVQAAGWLTAVLTNGTGVLQRRKLAALGVRDRLGPLFCADETGLSKPDPRAYLMVCDALELAPARVLHVGDREDLDYLAPRAAGLQAVQIDRAAPVAQAASPARISSLRALSDRC